MIIYRLGFPEDTKAFSIGVGSKICKLQLHLCCETALVKNARHEILIRLIDSEHVLSLFSRVLLKAANAIASKNPFWLEARDSINSLASVTCSSSSELKHLSAC